jgi:hypothetical protein
MTKVNHTETKSAAYTGEKSSLKLAAERSEAREQSIVAAGLFYNKV